MDTSIILLVLALIGGAAYFAGLSRATSLAGAKLSNIHSRPGYYGAYTAVWALLPALLILVTWLILSPIYVNSTVHAAFPDEVKAETAANQRLTFSTVGMVARGLERLNAEETAQVDQGTGDVRALIGAKGIPLASDVAPYMVTAAKHLNALNDTSRLLMTVLVVAAAIFGAVWACRRITARFRARNQVEKVMLASLIGASCIAILTTIGIVASMLTEAMHFFHSVSPWEFFFGTVWDPRFAAAGAGASDGQFGLIPLLLGTLYIGLVAMLVAVPVGLFAAIYMSEYAGPKLRSTAKPLLEVLAGIPTIVYGFFALVSVGPFLRDISAQLSGLVTGNYTSFIQAQSVLTAGFVMGIMLIPYVSSLSDDIITAVPRALRDGSLGLGATRSETVKRVILPAALPGIVGALLMTASRAIGETMIVVLAAGVAARMQLSPFDPMTTVTVKIVNQLTGDLEFTSPQTLVAFALGITLFAITLCLNIYALYIVRKYREQYE
jgi:phosphate transport system permease protein